MIGSSKIFSFSLFLISFIFAGTLSFAQENPSPDELPFFQGCAQVKKVKDKRQCSNEKLVKYLQAAIEYPESARKEKIEGTVYLSFVVNLQGNVEQIEVLRGIGEECDAAALAIVKEMPKWEPAVLDGQAVAAKMNLPVQFSLEEEGRDNETGYRIIWSNLSDRDQLGAEEIMTNIDTPITLLDLNGNRIQYNELTFIKAKGAKFKNASSAGAITPAMRKLVKKLKAGQYFSIVATIQVNGDFDYVEKEWLIEK